jgi:hypothetical protein
MVTQNVQMAQNDRNDRNVRNVRMAQNVRIQMGKRLWYARYLRFQAFSRLHEHSSDFYFCLSLCELILFSDVFSELSCVHLHPTDPIWKSEEVNLIPSSSTQDNNQQNEKYEYKCCSLHRNSPPF